MDHAFASVDDAVATKGRRDRETTLSDLCGSVRRDSFVVSEVNIKASHGVESECHSREKPVCRWVCRFLCCEAAEWAFGGFATFSKPED